MDRNNKVAFEGEIDLGGYIIPCYVLEDGTRVISGFAMQSALKITDGNNQSGGNRVAEILGAKSLEPFINKEKSLTEFEPLICYKGEFKINGYEASALADICEIFLDARKNITLASRQQRIADQCEILMRGFARVGISALVDEATGYQYKREKDELQKILTAYVSDEILKWQLTFTDEFYQEIFRLWKIPYTSKYIKNKPSFFGTLTTKFIYSQMPDGVIDKIKEKSSQNKKGHYKYRWHQSLTPEIGREQLKKQIHEVTALMSICDTKEQFEAIFAQKYNAPLSNITPEDDLEKGYEEISLFEDYEDFI